MFFFFWQRMNQEWKFLKVVTFVEQQLSFATWAGRPQLWTPTEETTRTEGKKKLNKKKQNNNPTPKNWATNLSKSRLSSKTPAARGRAYSMCPSRGYSTPAGGCSRSVQDTFSGSQNLSLQIQADTEEVILNGGRKLGKLGKSLGSEVLPPHGSVTPCKHHSCWTLG